MALKATQPTPAELGDHCLNYLIQNPDQLAEFMAISGMSPDSLRTAVSRGTITHGLIDYVAQNEPLLLAICAEASITPETFMRVWAKLNPAG